MRPSTASRSARVKSAAALPSTPVAAASAAAAARQRVQTLHASLLERTGATPETPASQQRFYQRHRHIPRGQAGHVHNVMGAADIQAAYDLMRAAIDGSDEDEEVGEGEGEERSDSSSSSSSGGDDFVDEVELRSGRHTMTVLRQMIQDLQDKDAAKTLQGQLDKLKSVFGLTSFFTSDPLLPNGLTERQLYSTALSYARLQPPIFQRQYLDNFLRECVTAHDSGNTVCLLGLKERLLFALAQATFGLLDHPRYGAEYSALAAALVPPDLTRPRLFGMIGTCTETLRSQFGPNRAANARLVEQCVRDRILADLGPLALRAPGAETLLQTTLTESKSEFVPPTPSPARGGGGSSRRWQKWPKKKK